MLANHVTKFSLMVLLKIGLYLSEVVRFTFKIFNNHQFILIYVKSSMKIIQLKGSSVVLGIKLPWYSMVERREALLLQVEVAWWWWGS